MAQAASNIIPFAFEDRLVRAMQRNGAPWFIGRDVCNVLEIKNESQALGRLDDDEREDGVSIIDPMGRNQTVIVVSEAGVYRLIFTSRRPEAERFKRWLAHEVLPAIRKTGKFEAKPADPDADPGFDLDAEAVRVVECKLAMVNTAARIFGNERARSVWHSLGLAVPPDPAPGGQHEAQDCLDYILLAEHGGEQVSTLLARAMNDDADAIDKLKAGGIWAEPSRDGFVVANRHPEMERIFAGTAWRNFQWCYKLRRLAGAEPVKPRKFETGRATRGVFLPATYLDLGARP